MNAQFYTIDEVATFLKVNKITVYRWIKAGKLPAYQIGRDYRIDVTDYAQFLMSFKVNNSDSSIEEQAQ